MKRMRRREASLSSHTLAVQLLLHWLGANTHSFDSSPGATNNKSSGRALQSRAEGMPFASNAKPPLLQDGTGTTIKIISSRLHGAFLQPLPLLRARALLLLARADPV